MHLTKIINKRGLDCVGQEIFILGLHSNGVVSYTIDVHGDCIYQSKLDYVTFEEENNESLEEQNEVPS